MISNGMDSSDGATERQTASSGSGSRQPDTSSSSPATRLTVSNDSERASAITALLHGERDTIGPEAEQTASPTSEAAPDGVPDEPGDAAGPVSADEGEGEGLEAPLGKPATLKEAAEKLGMSAEDVYKLALTTGDGGSVTLGELKDAYVSQETARRETAKREADLDQRETAITRSQQLWAQLGDQLGQVIPEDARQQLAAHLDETNAREQRMLLQVAPELQDETQLNRFREDVVETLAQYGYRPQEIAIGDHRQALVLRDLIRAKKRLKALEDYKPDRKPPRAKAAGRGAPASSNAKIVERARRGTEADKVAGVSALLKG